MPRTRQTTRRRNTNVEAVEPSPVLEPVAQVVCHECGQSFQEDSGDIEFVDELDDFLCGHCAETHYFVCWDCDQLHHRDTMTRTAYGRSVCQSCAENYYYCDRCGSNYHHEDVNILACQTLCNDCYNENYIRCEDCGTDVPCDDAVAGRCPDCGEDYVECPDCGEHRHQDRMVERNGREICNICNQRYRNCSRCHTEHYVSSLRTDDEGNPLCQACHQILYPQHIHDYSYKPEPIFHGNGKRQIGLELEVDCSTNLQKMAKELYAINHHEGDNPENLFYMKRDSSLTHQGVEIVTHPCTLDYYKKDFPFDAIIGICRKYEALSHEAENKTGNTCGLHFHLNRESFSNDDYASLKLVYIFEKLWKKMVKFSRRRNFGFCKKNDSAVLSRQEIKIIKRKVTAKGRHQCVNLCPAKTIEVRICRGSLRKDTLLASLELMDILMIVCEDLSAPRIQKITWQILKDVAVKKNYKNFLEYCKEISKRNTPFREEI